MKFIGLANSPSLCSKNRNVEKKEGRTAAAHERDINVSKEATCYQNQRSRKARGRPRDKKGAFPALLADPSLFREKPKPVRADCADHRMNGH